MHYRLAGYGGASAHPVIKKYAGNIREVLLRRSSLELSLNLGKVRCGNGRLFFIVLLRKVNFTYISNTLQPVRPRH